MEKMKVLLDVFNTLQHCVIDHEVCHSLLILIILIRKPRDEFNEHIKVFFSSLKIVLTVFIIW